MTEPDPDVGDPLAKYRHDVPGTTEAIERRARERGEALVEAFSGGPPVVLTRSSLWLSDEQTVYRLPREDVTGLGQVRSTDYSKMRWGVGLYLVALIGVVLVSGGRLNLLGIGLVALGLVGGGLLVVFGFLAKALLVQVEDERIPPFVVEHKRWRRIQQTLDAWYEGPPG